MRITLNVDIPDSAERYIPENAVSRMLDTMYNVAGASRHPDADLVRDDIKDCKRIITSLWQGASNAIFLRHNPSALDPSAPHLYEVYVNGDLYRVVEHSEDAAIIRMQQKHPDAVVTVGAVLPVVV